MKIIGFQSESMALVLISSDELMNLNGHCYRQDANSHLSFELFDYTSFKANAKKDINSVPDIPVAKIFKEAIETLETYSELKTKLESVRNQITTLTKKMEKLNPEQP